MRSFANYHGGVAAERIVAQAYVRRGHDLAQVRWRGASGEIDLILRDGAALIFVEVKKSTSFGKAAHRISARQAQRIMGAALEYVATEPNGQDTEMRFDVALVDRIGQVEIIENAFQDILQNVG